MVEPCHAHECRRNNGGGTMSLTLSEAMRIVWTVFPEATVEERDSEIVIYTNSRITSSDEHYAPIEVR